jgi:multicomponent Na+:H+ antiporter subunit F
LAEATDTPALKDVALVFVVLAAVTSVAFVRLAWTPTTKCAEEKS